MSITTKCKTKYLAKSVLIYSAVSLCLILSAKILFAQEAGQSRTIIISPPTVTENFDPGATKEGTVKITNTSPTDSITFTAVVRDFIVEDTVGTPLIQADFPANKKKYAASSWVGVYPTQFTLAPGKTQVVNYYIQIPPDARPGGRYAAVVYESQDRLGVQGTGTGVETHIGSLFVFRINGDIVENATVKKFEAKGFSEYGPVTINTQILNSSDSHIRPVGTISVKNLIGQTIQRVQLDEHNIFPEAARDFVNEVGEKLMFGPYTAELNATYGTNNSLTLFATTTFWVIPWKIVAVVILIIVAAILLFIYLRRRKKSGHSHVDTTPPAQSVPPQPAPTPQQ